MDKQINEMTEKEILRQQLELLAEISKSSKIATSELASISSVMLQITQYIENKLT